MTKRSFFSALLGRPAPEAPAEAAPAPAPVVPPVDLNVPVTNPRLVAAIRKHQQSGNNQTAAELFAELKSAVLLAAIVLDQPPEKTSQGQAVFKAGSRIAVVEISDNDNQRLLALYTDHEELRRFTQHANSTLVLPTKDAMSFVLDKGYAGLVVNPASEATLRLDAPFIRRVIGDL
jgi:hypothetical protein